MKRKGKENKITPLGRDTRGSGHLQRAQLCVCFTTNSFYSYTCTDSSCRRTARLPSKSCIQPCASPTFVLPSTEPSWIARNTRLPGNFISLYKIIQCSNALIKAPFFCLCNDLNQQSFSLQLFINNNKKNQLSLWKFTFLFKLRISVIIWLSAIIFDLQSPGKHPHTSPSCARWENPTL